MPEPQEAALETPRRDVGRTIARNTVFGIGAQFALKFATLLFNILVVRSLGGEAYGQYTIVVGWAGLFSVIGDLGVTQYFTREVARDPKNIRQLFWDTVVLRFLLAILATLVTVVGASLFLEAVSTDMLVGVLLFTTTYFFQALLTPLGNVLTGSERVDLTSVFAVIMQVMFMLFAAAFLLLGLNFVWMFIAGIINLPIMIALHLRVIRRNRLGPPTFKINPALWSTIIRAGLPFGLIQLSLSFAYRVDTIVLNNSGISQLHIGWYSIAYLNLTLMILNITTSFNNAILPTLSREHVHNPDVVRGWYFRSVKYLLFLGLPIAVGGMMLSMPIINFLYPEELPAALALSILVWDIPFVMFHSFCGNVAQSIKHEGVAARIYFSLGVVNLALNLILAPRFGIIGSAFATVLTDVVGAVQFYFLFRYSFGPGLGFNRLTRVGLSAVLMGAIVYLLRDQNLFLVIALGVGVYLAAVWLTGAFSPEERAQLTGFITRRLRPQTA